MTAPDAGGRVLSARDLNRAVLARQLLLGRADLPLPRAVERMGLLQAQYAPSMYIGLWSRVADFRRADLTAALESRSLVQGTSLRATIHLTSAEDWWPAALAVRRARRRWWLAARRGRPGALEEVESAAARVRDRLAGGPQRRSVVQAELGLDAGLWNGVNLWLDLVRVPPSGTWERRSADLHALAEAWIGPPPPGATEESGLALLLRRYLGAFGPAPLADAATWAGVPPATLKPVAADLDLRRFRDEAGTELLDLADGPLPGGDTPAPVRFLPTWDAVLLVHARRARLLREDDRPALFSTKTPHSSPSFLVDGHVAGRWRHDGGRIVTEAFRPLSRTAARAVAAEAEALVELHR
ncbi:MAG TPA: winged helix DNA-binding domain-containing protein [Acidimicrobiales bacterium]|nr:winged helix DNA-binding domain-containing protein [Acidimicrobiales bacterium]